MAVQPARGLEPASREPVAESAATREPPSAAAAVDAAPVDAPQAATVARGTLWSVSINAFPWATIEIDGKAVGETPLANVEVSEGEHVFVARLPDGRVLSRTVEIGPDNVNVAFR